jgi:hypothetical protein
MPIPENTGLQDFETGHIYPRNLGTWANLASTREITISSNALATSTANITVGNISFGNLTINNSTLTANSNVIILTTSTANIANISVGMTVYNANISANTTVTSIRNSSSGVTWASLRSWLTNPATYFYWNSPIIDNGTSIVFNSLISADADGDITYEIRSTDGGFDGDETLITVNPGATDITAHQGQFVAITANVVSSGSVPVLRTMDVNIINERFILPLNGVDTSTLSGTSSNRQLDLGRQTSYIYNIQMTPYLYTGGSGYTNIGYFTTGYIDETLVTGAFPQIIDKTNGNANIAVVDNDGNYIDSQLDILVHALPEQYRDGNNISQR